MNYLKNPPIQQKHRAWLNNNEYICEDIWGIHKGCYLEAPLFSCQKPNIHSRNKNPGGFTEPRENIKLNLPRRFQLMLDIITLKCFADLRLQQRFFLKSTQTSPTPSNIVHPCPHGLQHVPFH